MPMMMQRPRGASAFTATSNMAPPTAGRAGVGGGQQWVRPCAAGVVPGAGGARSCCPCCPPPLNLPLKPPTRLVHDVQPPRELAFEHLLQVLLPVVDHAVAAQGPAGGEAGGHAGGSLRARPLRATQCGSSAGAGAGHAARSGWRSLAAPRPALPAPTSACRPWRPRCRCRSRCSPPAPPAAPPAGRCRPPPPSPAPSGPCAAGRQAGRRLGTGCGPSTLEAQQLHAPRHPRGHLQTALTSAACSSAMEAVRPLVMSESMRGLASGTGNTCLAATTAHSAKPP